LTRLFARWQQHVIALLQLLIQWQPSEIDWRKG
jgi:hypothetical protein